VRLLPLGQTTRMRQWVVLLPHPAPGSIIPMTPHPAPSSAMMVVAMPASDANSKVNLNHNDQDATPHGGASCCDSVIGDLHWSIAYQSACLKSAMSGLMHRNKPHLYSTTLSARATKVADSVRPSAFAALRLIANSNLIGCSTGMSAGFTPRRSWASCRDQISP
jgi:hypothetical protein